MGADPSLAQVRDEVEARRFRDLVERARRLSGVPPGETVEKGCEMIESVHRLRIREA